MKIRYFILIILIMSFFIFIKEKIRRADSYVDVKIEMDKEHFSYNDKFEGKVIVTNSYPANIPLTFEVILLRNGQLFRHEYVSTAVFTGKTEYDFKSFGLNGFYAGTETKGEWRLFVQKGGETPVSAVADFTIGDEFKKTNE